MVFFAFNPLAIRYGDSIRVDGLGIFMIPITFGLIWKFVEAPSVLRMFWEPPPRS